MARQAAWRLDESWASKAMAIRIQNAKALPEYGQAMAAAEMAALETIREYRRIKGEGNNPVEYMRSRGGWPQIIEVAFRAAAGDAAIPGNDLMPATQVAGLLEAQDVGRIVNMAIGSR